MCHRYNVLVSPLFLSANAQDITEAAGLKVSMAGADAWDLFVRLSLLPYTSEHAKSEMWSAISKLGKNLQCQGVASAHDHKGDFMYGFASQVPSGSMFGVGMTLES